MSLKLSQIATDDLSLSPCWFSAPNGAHDQIFQSMCVFVGDVEELLWLYWFYIHTRESQ